MNQKIFDKGPAFRDVLVLASGALSIALVSGCGSGSAQPMPHTEALVRSADIKSVVGGSPGATALRLWRAIQVGDAPSAASFYDQRVLRTIGFTRVSATLAQQRTHLEVLRPKILAVNQTPLGSEVIVKATNMVRGTRQDPIEILSFVFRRAPLGWRVAYDTLLGDSLPAYVQSQVQEQIAPGSQTPSPKAQIAGQRIGDKYRSLFSDVIERATATNHNKKVRPQR